MVFVKCGNKHLKTLAVFIQLHLHIYSSLHVATSLNRTRLDFIHQELIGRWKVSLHIILQYIYKAKMWIKKANGVSFDSYWHSAGWGHVTIWHDYHHIHCAVVCFMFTETETVVITHVFSTAQGFDLAWWRATNYYKPFLLRAEQLKIHSSHTHSLHLQLLAH